MTSPTPTTPRIRAIALCVFHHEGRILVFEGYDSVKRTHFFRPLGGGIEPGETSRTAVAREIAEELGLQSTDFKFLGVFECIFTLHGEPKHEIMFVYDGRFVEASVYAKAELHGFEANGAPLRATWRSLDSFADERLVPEGLLELLRQRQHDLC